MSKIITISGKAQAGKSTAADYIEKWLKDRGYCGVKQVASADILKRIVHDIFGIPLEWLHGTNEDKNRLTQIRWDKLPVISAVLYRNRMNDEFMTVREFLIYFGSDICRRMYEDCWINAAKKYILDKNITIAILSDVRFPNEVDSFVSDPDFDVYFIRLTRNPLKREDNSETAMDSYLPPPAIQSFVVNNDEMEIEKKNKCLHKIMKSIQEEND